MPSGVDDKLTNHRILIVDDEQPNLLLLRRILEDAGYTQVVTTAKPTEVSRLFVERTPDLLMLDLHMPRIDGIELMERLAPATGDGTRLPILVITADATEEARRRALSLGARDFLTKPFDRIELLLRVRNLLHVHQLQARLRDHNETLEQKVAERTRELDRARVEALGRLALAAEYRDDDTQQHARRIGRTSGQLARELGLPDEEVELIRRAAPLHDVGKIGIPDSILLKPGKLTEEEFEAMKDHATIGAEILSGGRSSLLRCAERIALTHHERWDGSGYPRGLAGEDVPLEGRIVAVADVFDALTHERPYKHAWPVGRAAAEVSEQSGRQFDPAVVSAFATLDHPSLLEPLENLPAPMDGDPSVGVAHASPETRA